MAPDTDVLERVDEDLEIFEQIADDIEPRCEVNLRRVGYPQHDTEDHPATWWLLLSCGDGYFACDEVKAVGGNPGQSWRCGKHRKGGHTAVSWTPLKEKS